LEGLATFTGYCFHLETGTLFSCFSQLWVKHRVKKDAELTYRKIEHPDTSAVVVVLKAAAAGDIATEETELLEKISNNPGIRDRVFYVFNRIDETWFATELRQKSTKSLLTAIELLMMTLKN
jgi:hypothetical protein